MLEEVAATCEVEALKADNDGLDVELGSEDGKEVEEDSPPADTAGTSSSVSSPSQGWQIPRDPLAQHHQEECSVHSHHPPLQPT